MAYSVAWNEASPLGSDPANTLHTIIQNKQIASRERLAGIFGLTSGEWAADPIVPKTLALSVSLTVPTVTGNVTGNLTGTILTAAQANITSLGTLVSLAVTGAVTAGSFAGPLTGTVTTAAQPNITSLGTLTSLTVTEAISAGQASAIGGVGNGFTIGSAGGVNRIQWNVNRFELVSSANVLTDLHVATLTGNVTGNLTGTVLTAAQTNITSLGTLTVLNVASGVSVSGPVSSGYGQFQYTGGELRVQAYDYTGGGTGFKLLVLNGLSHLWRVSDVDRMSLAAGGQFLVGTTSISGVGAGGIGVAGQSRFDGLVNLTATSGSVIQSSGNTSAHWIRLINTGADSIWGVEGSAGGAIYAGTAAYSAVLGATGAKSLHLATNNTVRFTIDSAGAVSALGAWTFNSTVSGITTLTADTGTFTSGLTVTSNGMNLANTGAYKVNGTQVVWLRHTGWAAPTGTQSRTAIANGDSLITTVAHLAALVADLTSHGLIGA